MAFGFSAPSADETFRRLKRTLKQYTEPKSKKEEFHLINNRSVNLKTYCRIHMQIAVTIIAFHCLNIAYFKKIRVNKERFCYISSLALLGLDKQTHMVHLAWSLHSLKDACELSTHTSAHQKRHTTHFRNNFQFHLHIQTYWTPIQYQLPILIQNYFRVPQKRHNH